MSYAEPVGKTEWWPALGAAISPISIGCMKTLESLGSILHWNSTGRSQLVPLLTWNGYPIRSAIWEM
jgi:hypothetical protein